MMIFDKSWCLLEIQKEIDGSSSVWWEWACADPTFRWESGCAVTGRIL